MLSTVHASMVAVVLECFSMAYDALDSPIASPEELVRPAIIVFNPDMIIWPFNFEDLKLPLIKKSENVVLDQAYRHLKLYRQVPALLAQLHARGHRFGLVSQAADNGTLCQLLDLFNITGYITYREIYPGNITEHVEAIHLKADIDYGDTMYVGRDFDEIGDLADLGMVCILVSGDGGGVRMADVEKAAHVFATESPEYSYSEESHDSSYMFKE